MTSHVPRRRSGRKPVLVLGSASPRRRDLLGAARLAFEVIKPDVDEVPRLGEKPRDYVLRNAGLKGAWVAEVVNGDRARFPQGAIVVSADTIVVVDGEILEKPRDPDHAVLMLERLSGREHEVLTGVGLVATDATPQAGASEAFVVSTVVSIKSLVRPEILAYVRTGEPLDKAGAYAAQGIGSYMVRSIRGSYANVVGLPIAEVVESLAASFGYSMWDEEGADASR